MQPDLTTLNQNVQTAGAEAAKLQESIPGLLSGLKQNLTSIFTQNNPMFQQRESALNTFLNTPSATRAELLPGNQPMVEGSPLNFSPTQQNQIVTARQNAALVPLAGLNQSIVGQYGNLADMLSSAGGIYQAQLGGAQQRQTLAQQLYENAVAQAKEAERIREWGIEEARKGREGSTGLDLSSMITALLQGQQQQQRPDIKSFDIPDEIPAEVPAPANPIDFRSQPIGPPSPGLWDSLMGFIGATPKQGLEQPVQPGGLNLSGYNFGNVPIKLGV